MTDTPILPPTYPPPHWSDRVKSVVGDLARPYVLVAVGTATAKVIWAEADQAVIGAAGFLLAALYAAKAAENYGQARETAKVATTKAQTGATQ